jgi:hypothetical protein
VRLQTGAKDALSEGRATVCWQPTPPQALADNAQKTKPLNLHPIQLPTQSPSWLP